MKPSSVRSQLDRLLAQRILVIDGAMGTMLQAVPLGEADFRGERFRDHPRDLKGDNEILVLTRPNVVEDVHRAYLEAGADIIETNTFGSTRIAQADYGTEACVYEQNKRAAELALQLANEYSARTPAKPRFVAGAIGPTNRTLSISPTWTIRRGAASRSTSWRAPTASRSAASSTAGCTCC